MDCEEILESLSALDDGELSPEEKETVEAHLARCESCRKRRADYQAVWGLLGTLAGSEPSERFRDEVVRKAKERRAAGPRRRTLFQAVAAVAAS
ncbi:MAG: anti-sigma factor family protein, partial [Planctomycetota bacterium]